MTALFSNLLLKRNIKASNLSSIGISWTAKLKFSTTNNLKLVHVHTFHRHGDRTPWAPIITTKKEIDSWKSKISQQYYPKSAWNMSREEITTWKYIASTLKTTKLSYKQNNWHISSPTIFTSSETMDKDQWSRLRTYDSFELPYLGQLTEIGCQQLQSVGKRLRERYINNIGYLPDIYDENTSNLYYNCTNMKRTIHSADNVLSQLYPMENRINNALIPIHVDYREYTYLNPSTLRRVCAKLNIKGPDNLRKTINRFDSNFDVLTAKVLNHYGVKEEDLRHSAYDVAFDSMYCKMAHGMDDIPGNFTDDDLMEFGKYMAKIHCGMMNWDRESLKLSWGNVVYHMLEFMKIYDDKFMVSSCHDNSLLAVLCSVYGEKMFDIDVKWPYYGDFITFEVWKDMDNGSKNVRLLYNLEGLKAFNGKDMIKLNDLEEKWKDIMIDEKGYFNDACVIDK